MPPVLPKRVASPSVPDGSPASWVASVQPKYGAPNPGMVAAGTPSGSGAQGYGPIASGGSAPDTTYVLSPGAQGQIQALAGQGMAQQQNMQAVYTYLRRQQQSAVDDSNTNLQNLGMSFVSASDGSTQMFAPPTAGGTGTRTVFTQGAMVFAGPQGVYAQDSGVQYNATSKTLTAGNVSTSGTLSGGATAVSSLAVSGTTTLTGAATLSSLTVSGAASVGGNLTVSGTITGSLNISGNLSVPGTLTVAGATTLQSTLAVTGATTLSSTLAVTGAATFSSTGDFQGVVRVAPSGGLTTTTAQLAVQQADQTTCTLELRNSSSSGTTQIGSVQVNATTLSLTNAMAGRIAFFTGSAAGTTNETGSISAIGRWRTQMGTASNNYQGVMGQTFTQTSPGGIGNAAGGADTLLMSWSMPAGTMGQNGDHLRASWWGSFASDANSKQVIIKFAGLQVIRGTVTSNGVLWYGTLEVIRITATTVSFVGVLNSGDGISAVAGSASVPVPALGMNATTVELDGAATNVNEVFCDAMAVWSAPIYA